MTDSSSKRTSAEAVQTEIAEHVEKAKLTPAAVRPANEARFAARREQILSEVGLTEETLSTAGEELKAKLGSTLLYEIVHSPKAQLYQELMKAAVAREQRLEIESQVNEIRARYADLPAHRIPRKPEMSNAYLRICTLRSFVRAPI